MSSHISNHKANKWARKQKKAKHREQMVMDSSPTFSRRGRPPVPRVSSPLISEINGGGMPSRSQGPRKQAGKRGGAFFVSVVLHLTGALIATAYVVQEKIVNEDLMQGVLMKPPPKTATSANCYN